MFINNNNNNNHHPIHIIPVAAQQPMPVNTSYQAYPHQQAYYAHPAYPTAAQQPMPAHTSYQAYPHQQAYYAHPAYPTAAQQPMPAHASYQAYPHQQAYYAHPTYPAAAQPPMPAHTSYQAPMSQPTPSMASPMEPPRQPIVDQALTIPSSSITNASEGEEEPDLFYPIPPTHENSCSPVSFSDLNDLSRTFSEQIEPDTEFPETPSGQLEQESALHIPRSILEERESPHFFSSSFPYDRDSLSPVSFSTSGSLLAHLEVSTETCHQPVETHESARFLHTPSFHLTDSSEGEEEPNFFSSSSSFSDLNDLSRASSEQVEENVEPFSQPAEAYRQAEVLPTSSFHLANSFEEEAEPSSFLPGKITILPTPDRQINGIAYLDPLPLKRASDGRPLSVVDRINNILRERKVDTEELKSIGLSASEIKSLRQLDYNQKQLIRENFPSDYLTTTRNVQQFMLNKFGKILPASKMNDDWILQNRLTMLSSPVALSLSSLVNIAKSYNLNQDPLVDKHRQAIRKIKVLRYCYSHPAYSDRKITPDIINQIKSIAHNHYNGLSIKTVNLVLRAIFGISYMRDTVKKIMEREGIPISNYRLQRRPPSHSSINLTANLIDELEEEQLQRQLAMSQLVRA